MDGIFVAMNSILSVTPKDCTALVSWSHCCPIQATAIKKTAADPTRPRRFYDRINQATKKRPPNFAYMLSIMTCPNPEQLTWVAPSIRRAKS